MGPTREFDRQTLSPISPVTSKGDEQDSDVPHALLAHVAERHRRAGRVAGLGHDGMVAHLLRRSTSNIDNVTLWAGAAV